MSKEVIEGYTEGEINIEDVARATCEDEIKGMKLDLSYGNPRISSEACDCAVPLSGDFYMHCSGDCLYCFAKSFKSNNPTITKKLKAVNPERIKKLFKGEDLTGDYKVFYEYFIKNKAPMQIGGLTDPFDNFEKQNRVGLELIKFFNEIEYPITFSTKFPLCAEPEYLDVFKEHPENWFFKFSIITYDEDKAKLLEIGVPTPKERIEAMRKLSRIGVYTTLRLRPYIIRASDPLEVNLIEDCAKAGAKSVSLEFFCMESRANEFIKKRYALISKAVGYDIVKYYKKATITHGGYLRLDRTIKYPYFKRVYEACRKNKLYFFNSDAHFKEMSDGAFCCGMIESNPKFQNYKRHWGQLLIDARRHAWKTGESKLIHWSDISQNFEWGKNIPVQTYFPLGIDKEERWLLKRCSIYDYMRTKWNNPNGKASPYKYFEGKMKPVSIEVDKDGIKDVVYKYLMNADEYELMEIDKKYGFKWDWWDDPKNKAPYYA